MIGNRTNRDFDINALDTLVPITALDNTGVTGSSVDLTDVGQRKAGVAVIMSALVDIARVFVKIQEDDGSGNWSTLVTMGGFTAAGTYYQRIKRTKRYIRAVIVTEPPASPTAPAFTAAILLIS